jgi:DNA-binding NarL/FixJ family response regulator
MSVFTKIGKIVSQSLDDLLQSEGDGARKGRETVSVGYRSGRFKGSSDSLIKIARIGVGATIIVGTGYVIFQVGKAIFIYAKDRISAKEKIKQTNADTEAKIAVINADADAKIRVVDAKATARAKAHQEGHQYSQQSYGDSMDPNEYDSWLDEFNISHPFPFDALPDDFATVISGCDPDIAPAMFLHLCSMYGALCFSRVAAKKRGDEVRRPNLQVVIDAMPGIGKSQFRNVHQMLFRRVIDEDKQKLNAEDDDKNHIIQTVGIDISSARLQQILETNQGVHVYIFDSEIATATNKDLSVYLRKAFDNDDVSRERMHKKQNGSCEAVINATLTGTGDNVETFVKNIATVEGGGASRVCWCAYPLDGDSDDAPISLIEGPELELMRDRIDEYRHKYVFTTDDGEDTAVDLVEIKDFDYVMSALKDWERKQVDLSKQTNDDVRKLIRWRISTIAMHIGIVMHMMIQPNGDQEKMDKVVQLVIYAAEHCMSRYLWLFGAQHNKMIQDIKNRERVPRQRVNPIHVQAPYYSTAIQDDKMEQRRADVIRLKKEGLNQHQIALELELKDSQVARILAKEGLK